MKTKKVFQKLNFFSKRIFIWFQHFFVDSKIHKCLKVQSFMNMFEFYISIFSKLEISTYEFTIYYFCNTMTSSWWFKFFEA